MSDDAGFLIEGQRYELPDMGTFTVRESRVFWKATGLVTEVVRMRLADGSLTYMELLENIGFLPALATIAYMREHIGVDETEIDSVIDQTSRDDLFMALLDVGEDEPDPPSAAETRPPPDRSQNGSSSPTGSNEPTPNDSGPSSTPSSEKQVGLTAGIGITASDTLHTSAPTRSVI